MNMIEFGYVLAVGLILMVAGVHGARLPRARRMVDIEAAE